MTQISIRMDDDTRKRIEALVESGDFSTVSEFCKYAIRKTLNSYSGRVSPPPPMIVGPDKAAP